MFLIVRKIDWIDETPFYYYVQRSNSSINLYDERVNDIFKVIDNIYEYVKERKLLESHYQEIEYHCIMHSTARRAAASSAPRTSGCAAVCCGTPPPGAAAPKRPWPCGSGCWTGRPGISRALKIRRTFCWTPPLPTSCR